MISFPAYDTNAFLCALNFQLSVQLPHTTTDTADQGEY